MTTGTVNDTQGACAICNRQPPAGWSVTRTGAVVLGAGVGAGLVGWLFKEPVLSGALCTVGVGLGGPLLLWGVLRGVRGPAAFAEGTLTVDRPVAEPGSELGCRLALRPEHPLSLRQLVLELRACEETGAQGAELAGPRVLRTQETIVEGRGPFTTPLAREVRLRIPDDWPVTMEAPHAARVPRRRVFTEVRVTADFDAHPLFELSRTVVVAARG